MGQNIGLLSFEKESIRASKWWQNIHFLLNRHFKLARLNFLTLLMYIYFVFKCSSICQSTCDWCAQKLPNIHPTTSHMISQYYLGMMERDWNSCLPSHTVRVSNSELHKRVFTECCTVIIVWPFTWSISLIWEWWR